MTGLVPVIAAPHFDPGQRRITLEFPEGLTIAEMVRAALPCQPSAELAQVRVALVTARGTQLILPEHWARVRPKAGVRVVIRLVAGKNALKSVLSIVVAVAAFATGTWFAGSVLGLTAGTTAYSLAFAGASLAVTALGQLLINALIPPIKPEDRNAANRYSISGLRNRLDPNGAVPVVLGSLRYAPPYAALPYTEIVGDFQYVRALFNFGEGRVQLDDIRIGETSISEYSNVEIEAREGVDADTTIALYPRQIAEETVGVALTRPLPRDELGEIIAGVATTDTPIVRTTGADASGASIILAFPSGMIRFDKEGRSHAEGVSVRVEYRRVDADDWVLLTQLDIVAKKLESFYRQHSWEFPTRARYQVRLTLLNDETTDSTIQRSVSWAALQTLRPEYPLAYPRPLSLVAVRIKATHQLSGALDNISALGTRICADYDHVSGLWVERATSNPASLYRYVLQAPCNPKAVSDAGLDLGLLEEWHDFCRIKGLSFNKVFDDSATSLRDVLTQIAAVGRATPRHDGARWGVTIDRAQDLIIDHLDAQNSSGLRATRSFIDHPHAFRVKFSDQTNDFKDAERVVRWPGYTGEITVTEALDMPGITDPDLIWREARRRQYEAIYRPDSYQVTQIGPVRVATRGDKVMLNHYVLDSVQASARVRNVIGALIELDQPVEMVNGQAYAVRFRVFDTEAAEPDSIGTSTVRTVKTVAGERDTLTLTGTGPMPQIGDAVLFGRASAESLPLIVRGVERAQDNDEILHLVDEAPIIDTLLEADSIPTWTGRAGAELIEDASAPDTPRFSAITSGIARTGVANRIDYQLTAATGSVVTANFEVEHRLAGAASYSAIVLPVANGGGAMTTYAVGDQVELRARALAASGAASPWTANVTITVGADDAGIPVALDEAAISVTTLLGGALVQFATGADEATTQVQIYRSTSAVLDRDADAAGAAIVTTPLQSFSFVLGDSTRSNLISGGTMSSPAAWTSGAGWTIANGVASHVAGSVGTLSQSFAATEAKWYRVGFTVSGRSNGAVTPRLTGGTAFLGSAASANGTHSDRLHATNGTTTIGFAADSSFNGALDDVVAYLETAACLAQGTHYVWLEPQNADGIPGPVAGPFLISVV
ncbi:phage tail protein [Pseudorhodobacter sp. E13]|uniref:host specificity factor TipJ family phage tail protein n=1 Tax=Pseudorhodobacter sp. E13 TaxID=2487931 RepID=UPI000F8DDCD4|nr:host specificity factor TipJ family phage tail protein [Pseudorhodobacter sp. E13]RUS64913.1 phage tail protein [Pseudorhodobacter sp. E13]